MATWRTALAFLAIYAVVCAADSSTAREVEAKATTLIEQPGASDVEGQLTSFLGKATELATAVLEDSRLQIVIGVGMFAVGMMLLFEGEFVFRAAVAAFVFLVTYFVAMVHLDAQVEIQFPDPKVAMGIAVAASAIVGWAAYLGFEGVKVLMGGALGFYVSVEGLALLDTLLGEENGKFLHSPYTFVFVSTLLVILGVALFLGRTYSKVVNLLCAVVGGLLTSASIGYLVTLVCCHTGAKIQNHPLPAEPAPWIKFVVFLTQVHGEDVGVFGNQIQPNVNGFDIQVDRLMGWTCWLVLAFFGWTYGSQKSEMEYKKVGDGSLAQSFI